jgi:hypothetical protein
MGYEFAPQHLAVLGGMDESIPVIDESLGNNCCNG